MSDFININIKKLLRKSWRCVFCVLALFFCVCFETPDDCIDGYPCEAFTLTVNAGAGGTVTPANRQSATGGTSLSILAAANSGYEFVNWEVRSGEAEIGNRNERSTTVTLSSNATVRANFRLLIYTITFDPGDGSVSPASGTTGTNWRLTTLPVPAQRGYRFDGWFTAGTGEMAVTTSTAFSDDETVYARWTYVHDWGDWVVNPATCVDKGDSTRVCKLNSEHTETREIAVNLNNHDWEDWTVTPATCTDKGDSTRVCKRNSEHTEIREITIDLETLQYTVTLNANSGSVTPTSLSAAHCQTLAQLSLPTPARVGYGFDGWYTATTGGTKYADSYVVTDGVTLYAQWKINEYAVTLDGNGGAVTPTSLTANHGQTLAQISIPMPARVGYGFDGWYTATTGGTKYADSYVVTGDFTLYAQWKINEYTVTLDGNNGVVTPTSLTANHGQTLAQISIPMPARVGYGFDGWYTATTGGTKYADSYIVTGDFTLYAQWKINEYTVTLDGNNGAVTPASLTATHGQTLTELSLPMPTREGYDFDGWFSAATGGIKYADNYVVTGDVTLYAQWKRYTITLNANGGSVTPTSLSATHGQTLTQLSLPTPTRAGYDFDGWFSAATGGTKYADSYAVTGDVTLYAKWVLPNPFTDYRDGQTQTYRWVMIDNKIWMAENLDYAGPNNNIGVCLGNSADSCAKYGRLYTWAEAMNISSSYNSNNYGNANSGNRQGICPVGWRLPNDNDWNNLITAAGGWSTAGTKLKSQTGWNTDSGYVAGTNEFGFSALPGGIGYNGLFYYATYGGFWWSATESAAVRARHLYINSHDGIVRVEEDNKFSQNSLRCLLRD